MFVPFVFKASPPFLRRPGKYPPEGGSPGNTWNKEASLSSLLFPCASFRANNSYLRSWIILIISLENDFIISCNTVTHFSKKKFYRKNSKSFNRFLWIRYYKNCKRKKQKNMFSLLCLKKKLLIIIWKF